MRQLRGDAHVRLDNIDSFIFQQVGVEVERSLRHHDSVTMNLVQIWQVSARTIFSEFTEIRVPTITGGGPRTNGGKRWRTEENPDEDWRRPMTARRPTMSSGWRQQGGWPTVAWQRQWAWGPWG
jgi:hypothetical protein